ncbi:MAG: transaldolase [Bacteroidales bacterium]|nr:transaldolase [Bacteroidales bacterium]
MNAKTKILRDLGQSIWVDNITRSMLDKGILNKYINELSVTGLTSNPSIFDHAISGTEDYDVSIKEKDKNNISNEDLFFELAIEDIQRAADIFKPVFNRTNGIDGFVSIEVSPDLAFDTQKTLEAARKIFKKVDRKNVLVKIPGTKEGIPAIEQAIAEGISINVTLLFSAAQYKAAAEAWARGIEKRIAEGKSADVRSVASVFVSRWDKAVAGQLPEKLQNQLGITVMQETYLIYKEMLLSDRFQKIMNFGGSPQRLLWASTSTKDPSASDILYVKSLAAPFTVNTIPEKTLQAFAEHGKIDSVLNIEPSSIEKRLKVFENENIDINKLAQQLQQQGAESFVNDWRELMSSIEKKRK